jgi:hypothetical protein
MARQKEISSSLGGNEPMIGSCNSCGQRQEIGDILPWEDVEREAERLLENTRANARNSENSCASQEQDDDRDETDPYNEVIFGRRRPDSVAIEWTSTRKEFCTVRNSAR